MRQFTTSAAALLCMILVTAGAAAHGKPIDIKLGSGDTLRIEPVAPRIIRVRLSTDGNFPQSLMERYGIVRTQWDECQSASRQEGDATRVSTDAGSLLVRSGDGRMQLFDAQGKPVCQEILPLLSRLSDADMQAYKQRQAMMTECFKGEKRKEGQIQIIGDAAQNKTELSDTMHPFDLAPATRSFGATFALRDAERFYGLGTASARRIQLRGHAYRLWTLYRGGYGFKERDSKWEQTEGPIPFLMSTGGWGIFVNTTWVHYYDIGQYQSDKAFFWGPGGQLDFYLLIGDSLPKLMDLYTDITGKPRVLPLFAYGLHYVSPINQNQHEIQTDARLFRDRGIPCDLMGIEPQWMKKLYDFSHNKEWNQDKFYVPTWQGLNSKNGTFIGGLERIGFKLSLWLCCDDELTMEEERQIALREGRTDFSVTPRGVVPAPAEVRPERRPRLQNGPFLDHPGASQSQVLQRTQRPRKPQPHAGSLPQADDAGLRELHAPPRHEPLLRRLCRRAVLGRHHHRR